MGGGGKDKPVPVSVEKEPVIYVAHHTYCFFWACEARSLAFSLAASAVSLARSVAVSAKVLDGVSPTKGHNTLVLIWAEIFTVRKNLRRPFIVLNSETNRHLPTF